jgi:hypothetical protein
MDVLEKLFGSAAKVKIIKLFLFNPESAYDVSQTSERSKVSKEITRKEINNLAEIGFIKPRFYTKEVKRQKNRDMQIIRKRVNGWTLDPKFPYIEAIQSFLSNINPFRHKDIIDKISRAGKIQLLIISGIFIKNPDSRADLLVVGDNLKQTQLDNIMRTIESEIGKEIRYAVFETSEFNYRLSMFDKLIRDILDYPHEKIINKLNL